jgi:16S rRNA (adenine1518-N6/adenine1519-N6)-dimethyltransferase
VVAVELDAELAQVLRERGEERLEVIGADVLQTDLGGWGEAVIAGNLPYYITSPILRKIGQARRHVKRAVLLMQKEVAERVSAAPGTRDYGLLSVETQIWARTEMLCRRRPKAS